ncbi:MAG: hypothetical protein PSX36_03375 [bacterium]|nr:hypothetical protein [bacterium]
MKKSIVLLTLAVVGMLAACGPAAEDREKMHARAKVFQDSIANAIRTSMAEAEMPNTAPVQVLDTTLAGINARAAAAANTTVK